MACPGFDMQVGVTLSGTGHTVVHPTEQWQTATLGLANPSAFKVNPDYYVEVRDTAAGAAR